MQYLCMKLHLQRKLPLFALVLCISLAVVFAEVLAAAHLDHERIKIGTDCPDYLRLKAAAHFLDTLQYAILFTSFSVFLMFLPQTFIIIEEFIFYRLSLIALKVRQDT